MLCAEDFVDLFQRDDLSSEEEYMPKRISGERGKKEEKDKGASKKPEIGSACITTAQSHIAISIHGTVAYEVEVAENRITIIGKGISKKTKIAMGCCPHWPISPMHLA